MEFNNDPERLRRLAEEEWKAGSPLVPFVVIGGPGFGSQGTFEVTRHELPMPKCRVCGEDGGDLTPSGRGPYCGKHLKTLGRHRPRRCKSHTEQIRLKRLGKQLRPAILHFYRRPGNE